MFGTTNDFTADRFSPTEWEKAEAKVRFAKQFIRFIESDFDDGQFPHWFYRRLSLTFGHAAHFNKSGFYETFFVSTEGKVRFLRQTMQHPCWGDSAFTYSDVEKALKSWLIGNGILVKYEAKLAEEPGCKGCGSECGVPNCAICQGTVLCSKCQRRSQTTGGDSCQ